MAQETKTPPVILLPMELLEDFELLSNEELGEIIKAIFSYVGKKEKPKFKDRSLQFVFSKMKKICDVNFDKYQKICERNRKNISKRWEQNDDNSLENKGKTDDDTTGYQSIPVDTSEYHSIPVDTNIKYKSKNIKSKKENIKNKNNIKKEKVVKRKKANADGVATTTDFSSSFHFDDIVEIGKKFGINADYCKKFYAYYESNNWETMKGEKIVNVERLLKKWYNEDKKNKKAVGFISNDEEAIENDTKRIFENI